MKALKIFLLLLWGLGAHASEKKCVRGNFKVAVKKRVEHYLYGFNGQLKDNEWAGLGNEYEYKAREYDPQTGRFISIDPLTKQYPWYTPYQFAGNKPIKYIDRDGLEEADPEAEKPTEGEEAKTEADNGLKESPTPDVTDEEAEKNTMKFIENADKEKKEAAAEKDPFSPARKQAEDSKDVFQKSIVDKLYPPVNTPDYKEPIEQSNSPEAMKARGQVQQGATLYRMGTTGVSRQGADAQYWSTVNPEEDPEGFAQSLNIPKVNIAKADFIEQAQLKPGYNFVTRPAGQAPGADNAGSGIEVVVPWGGTTNNVITPINNKQ